MRVDLRVKHDIEARKAAIGLFELGHGYKSAAIALSLPVEAVRRWQEIYRAFGSEVLLRMDGKQGRYTYEQKVAAASAVVDGGMTKTEAMAAFGIMSMSPLKKWCALYRRGGAEALRPRPKGRPKGSKVDWQHLFGRFREGQPRLPELDRRHVAQRRVDPEVVVPVHVVRELGPELARRAERLAVDELGLQYPVGRLVDGVVVGAALGRQRPLNAEGLEHQVDLGVVELAAAVRVEDLDVRDGEGERRERRLDQPGVLPGPGGVADDLPVVEVDEQADVVPRGPDAHVGQVAAYMGARRPAAEAARDDVGHVGLVDRPGVHLEPLPAVCADQAVLPHDAADPAPADGDARPLERRLYLARAVPALAGGVGRDHGRRGGVRRGGPVGPRAHGVVRRPRDAEEPALR